MTPRRALSEIDIPPLWLGLCAAAVWALGREFPVPVPFGRVAGGGLVGLGLLLMGLAAAQMVLARTSFIPRRQPDRLVTNGVFALSRNPIYLGDALVLTGLCLAWRAPQALILVPAFMAFITHRFIRAEEAWIGAAYGPAYAAYRAKVRRWL